MERASDQDCAEALVNLGMYYERGFGCPGGMSDEARAVAAYERAVELSDPDGCALLATCYEHGFCGKVVDLAAADELYQRGLRINPKHALCLNGVARIAGGGACKL